CVATLLTNRLCLRRKRKAGEREQRERRANNIRCCFHGFISFDHFFCGSFSGLFFFGLFVLSQRYCPRFDLRLCGKLTRLLPNRRSKFRKRSQLFIRLRDEPLPVIAMCVCNPACSTVDNQRLIPT